MQSKNAVITALIICVTVISLRVLTIVKRYRSVGARFLEMKDLHEQIKESEREKIKEAKIRLDNEEENEQRGAKDRGFKNYLDNLKIIETIHDSCQMLYTRTNEKEIRDKAEVSVELLLKPHDPDIIGAGHMSPLAGAILWRGFKVPVWARPSPNLIDKNTRFSYLEVIHDTNEFEDWMSYGQDAGLKLTKGNTLAMNCVMRNMEVLPWMLEYDWHTQTNDMGFTLQEFADTCKRSIILTDAELDVRKNRDYIRDHSADNTYQGFDINALIPHDPLMSYGFHKTIVSALLFEKGIDPDVDYPEWMRHDPLLNYGFDNTWRYGKPIGEGKIDFRKYDRKTYKEIKEIIPIPNPGGINTIAMEYQAQGKRIQKWMEYKNAWLVRNTHNETIIDECIENGISWDVKELSPIEDWMVDGAPEDVKGLQQMVSTALELAAKAKAELPGRIVHSEANNYECVQTLEEAKDYDFSKAEKFFKTLPKNEEGVADFVIRCKYVKETFVDNDQEKPSPWIDGDCLIIVKQDGIFGGAIFEGGADFPFGPMSFNDIKELWTSFIKTGFQPMTREEIYAGGCTTFNEHTKIGLPTIAWLENKK